MRVTGVVRKRQQAAPANPNRMNAPSGMTPARRSAGSRYVSLHIQVCVPTAQHQKKGRCVSSGP
jgi:hypothetical protein